MAKKKQGHLPGMEPPRNKDLDRLADAYADARDERMQLLRTEINKRDLLHAKMTELGLKFYEFDGKTVEIIADEKVKVRMKKDEPKDDE